MAQRLFCMKWLMILTLSVGLGFGSLPVAHAQAAANYSGTPGPKRQLATIIFAGLGGAVMGLSTLSFYGRPQDNLNNIAIGFAIGVISGTLYTTYQAAAQPRSFYSLLESEGLSEMERNQDRFALSRNSVVAPLSYQISF